jgi:hypothetical protein
MPLGIIIFLTPQKMSEPGVIIGCLVGLVGGGVIVGQLTQPPQPPQLEIEGIMKD